MNSHHSIDPSNTLPRMEGWTYEAVEAALVEALVVARRVPDREAGWLHVKAAWPDLRDADVFDYGGEGVDGVSHVRIRPMPLANAQIDAMRRAESWLGRYLADEADRLLVRAALGWLAAGRRIGWTRIGKVLGLGVTRQALQRRYLTAVARIACGLNGKGEASVKAMVRAQMLAEARSAVGAGVGGEGSASRGRGQRRRVVEVDIVYSG